MLISLSVKIMLPLLNNSRLRSCYMNQQEMTNIIKEELKHIPSGYGTMHGWPQTYYNICRRDLTKRRTKEEILYGVPSK